jgi:hypothetical protein
LSVLEHYIRLWGEPARTAAYGPDDAQVYVYKWPAEQTRLDVTMSGYGFSRQMRHGTRPLSPP